MVKKKTTRKTASKPTLSLLSDQPVCEESSNSIDGLGFEKYSRVLADVAIQTPGPFTIGVFGEWGTGKTSLMKLVERDLTTEQKVITVWFNAWRYESEEQPIVPLVATIVHEIERNKDFLGKLEEGGKSFLRALRAVAYGFSAKSKVKVPGFAEIEASFVAKDMIDRSNEITPDPLLDRSIFFEAFEKLSQVRVPQGSKIVVLIDDLDRCFPDRAIKLLESIKLVLAQPGFIFFLGVSRQVIEGYLQHRYKKEYGISEFDGYAYLDKIVQLPFHIPPHQNRMPDFWKSVISRLDKDDHKSFNELIPIINFASGSNPRSVVRFVNNLLVDRAIFKAISNNKPTKEVPISFFAVSRSMQQRWPVIYNLLAHSDHLCTQSASLIDEDLSNFDIERIPELADILNFLKSNNELQELFKTKFGKEWLINHSLRNMTIDFLQTERQESLATEGGQALFFPYLLCSPSDNYAANEIESILKNEGIIIQRVPQGARKSLGRMKDFIENKIRSSQHVLCLLGKESDTRKLLAEIELLIESKKKVLAVLLPGGSYTSLPFDISKFPAFNLDKIDRDSMTSIIQLIRRGT